MLSAVRVDHRMDVYMFSHPASCYFLGDPGSSNSLLDSAKVCLVSLWLCSQNSVLILVSW